MLKFKHSVAIFAFTAAMAMASSANASCTDEANAYVNASNSVTLETLAVCLNVENRATESSCSDQAALYTEEQSDAMSNALKECISGTPNETDLQPSPVIKDIYRMYESSPNVEASETLDNEIFKDIMISPGDNSKEMFN